MRLRLASTGTGVLTSFYGDGRRAIRQITPASSVTENGRRGDLCVVQFKRNGVELRMIANLHLVHVQSLLQAGRVEVAELPRPPVPNDSLLPIALRADAGSMERVRIIGSSEIPASSLDEAPTIRTLHRIAHLSVGLPPRRLKNGDVGGTCVQRVFGLNSSSQGMQITSELTRRRARQHGDKYFRVRSGLPNNKQEAAALTKGVIDARGNHIEPIRTMSRPFRPAMFDERI
jgi:hypothetical protein